MSVEDALDLWPQLQATGRRLGSPAVATGGATPGGWLDRFMSGARAQRASGSTSSRCTGTARTSARTPSASSRGYVAAVYDRYHLPIWLTEFALIKFGGGGATYPTATQQVAFIKGATPCSTVSPMWSVTRGSRCRRRPTATTRSVPQRHDADPDGRGVPRRVRRDRPLSLAKYIDRGVFSLLLSILTIVVRVGRWPHAQTNSGPVGIDRRRPARCSGRRGGDRALGQRRARPATGTPRRRT